MGAVFVVMVSVMASVVVVFVMVAFVVVASVVVVFVMLVLCSWWYLPLVLVAHITISKL